MSIHAKFRQWQRVAQFCAARAADYGDLFLIELVETRRRLMRELIALVALAVAALFTLSFFCIAIIATSWGTPYFLGAVWGVAAFWLILSIAALVAVRAQTPVQSFGVLHEELHSDLETVKEALK